MLILKRNPDARCTERYNVLFEGRHVGRIYKAISHAPRETPWFWGFEIHECRAARVHGEIQKERPHSGAENIEADRADMAKIEAVVRAA